MAFFLPTRKGSERVKNKNTRPFAGIEGGLFVNKLTQLLKTKNIDEILISSNDEICLDYASRFKDSRLKIIERPVELCRSDTNLQDLITYVPTITDCENILWGHVTTPLTTHREYDEAVARYYEAQKNGYDSLIGVTELKNFLLNGEGRLVNNTTELQWPRTQDLEPLYEINHTMFIAGRDCYINQKNRVGKNPMLYVMDKIHSFDVDWEEDFLIAETMFKQFADKL